MKAEVTIFLLALLLVLDLVYTLVRASLINAHLPRLLNLRQDHETAVDQTIQRLERPRLRVSLRVAHHILLISLVGMSLWLLVEEVPDLAARGWLVLAALFAGALIIFFLESICEGIVLRDPETWALRMSGLAALTDTLLAPLSTLAIRLMGQTETGLQQISAPTDDELKTWVKQGQTEGALEKEERQMIYSIFQFGDTLAREIMVPRIDMLALDVQTGIPEALTALVESGHSRVPVYEDTVDNIIGLLYAKDLLKYLLHPENVPSLREKLRPVYFIPEAKKLDELLTELQTRRVHMAIVVDEYGGVAGLVTLEDIIEEIIGEVQDEYDQTEELPYTRVSDTEYIFRGNIDLNDFNEVMGTELLKDNAETLGGFMYSEIGKVPTGGEIIQVDSVKLVVEQVLGRRIRKIRAVRLTEEEQTDEEKYHAD
jgi:CBS domain containing-hemolysin-like protein